MHWIIRNDKEKTAVCDYVRQLNTEKGTYEVEVKKKVRRRTIPQNSLYWLWLTCIAFETGNDKDDLHSYFASRYLERRRCKVGGKVYEVRGSTADLDTARFTQYLDRIQRDAAEWGIQLIGPDNPLFEQFHETYRNKVV